MSQEIISCLFYPTTVIFIDDDETYLQQIGAIIRRELPCDVYKNAKDALKYLKEVYRNEPFTKRCMVEIEDISLDHPVIDFNTRLIREEAFNPERHKEIGVVVLDYAMHHINGGEVAKQLKGTPYKIILLTGEANAHTAVTLFNEGIEPVNHFV
jgi:CheY-like chemotaxis protein